MLVSVSSPVFERCYDRPANLNIGAACAGDLWDLVVPVQSCVDFSEDFERLDTSLVRFSDGLRGFFAALDYLSEVEKGGHDAYFTSPRAMLYEDALDFFMAASMPEVAALMEQAAQFHANAPLIAMATGQIHDASAIADFDNALACLAPVEALNSFARRHPDLFAGW